MTTRMDILEQHSADLVLAAQRIATGVEALKSLDDNAIDAYSSIADGVIDAQHELGEMAGILLGLKAFVQASEVHGG